MAADRAADLMRIASGPLNGVPALQTSALVTTEPRPPISRGNWLSAELHRYEAAIAHHIPGRVRLKFPRAYCDLTTLRRMKDAFDAVPAVRASEIRPSSASLVLYYDESNPDVLLTLDAVLRDRPRVGMGETTDVAGALGHDPAALERNGWPVSVSSTRSPRRSMIPIILAGATLMEIAFAAAPPLWLSLVLLFLKEQQRSSPA